MPQKPRRYKRHTNQDDDLWEQAWKSPQQMDPQKKQALLDAIHQRIDTRPRNKKLFIIGLSAAAAILIAVFMRIPANSFKAVPQWQELTSADVTKKVLLQDGSKLWLAPHSAIRVNRDFTNHRNSVLTRGTVFFSVAKDAQHPFSIRINSQQVTVLGTAFTVHKLDSIDLQLTVKEGKVALDHPGGRRLLTAGQQVNTSHAVAGAVQSIDPEAADWWLQQQVRFRNISLQELLDRIESYYHVQLARGVIKKDMKVTLTWDLAVPLQQNLAVLNTLTGYNIH
jgi:transmembrane sensor